jgi:hypothetical protein
MIGICIENFDFDRDFFPQLFQQIRLQNILYRFFRHNTRPASFLRDQQPHRHVPVVQVDDIEIGAVGQEDGTELQ